LFGHVWPAAAAGLLFGLHPMTVEPLCWVSERKTLLAAFFALWSLVLYLRFIRKNNCKLYFGCLLMYILALMSKPTSLPLPVMMLLMDYWPLKRLNRRAILEKLPLLLVAAVFALITYVSQSRAGTTVSPTQYGPQRIPLIICHNIIFYLYKIIWPANLSPLCLPRTVRIVKPHTTGRCHWYGHTRPLANTFAAMDASRPDGLAAILHSDFTHYRHHRIH